MRIKELLKDHPEILNLVYKNQMLQGNKPNPELALSDPASKGNFDWEETEQGGEFWGSVDKGITPIINVEAEVPVGGLVLSPHDSKEKCEELFIKCVKDTYMVKYDVVQNQIQEEIKNINHEEYKAREMEARKFRIRGFADTRGIE